jgi:hypothetical protein
MSRPSEGRDPHLDHTMAQHRLLNAGIVAQRLR